MVLNNVTKFQKILIKIFDLESRRHWDRRLYVSKSVRMYVRTDRRT